MTKLTKNQLALMSAILGVSNAGSDHLFEGHRADWTVDRIKNRYGAASRILTVDGVTTNLVAGLCENEEMLDMFVEEARSWVDRLRPMTVEKIKSTWPRYADYVECTT
jgi:hypothetical protein